MTSRSLLILGAVLALATTVYGQTNLTGKWQTDNVPAALEAEKAAQGQPAPEPGARGRGGFGGPQAIILDLKVDGGKVSGTVTEIGNPPVLNIESGTVDGNKITFVTQPRGVTWNVEVTDNNTLTLTSRVFARGGGAGRAGFGGGAAGGPPRGENDGAGAGGGRGGRVGGGGGRGGRGPAQPIVFHRAS